MEKNKNGNKKIITRLASGVLTDKYDDIRLKYVFTAKKLLNKREFFELIVGDRFNNKKKQYVMEIYDDFKQMRHCKTVDEVLRYANWAKHFIPNTFYKWHDKSLENMCSSEWMVFDFEQRKSTGKPFYPAEVYEIFNQTVGFAPTMVKTSKTPGNYHVFLHHTSINGSTESSYLFKRIQMKIAETIGTDMGAIGPNHSYSIPTKEDKVFFYGDNVIDFNDLKNWWIERIKEENKKTKYIQNKNGQVSSITDYMVWNHSAVLSLMNHTYDGSRNQAGFTLSLLFYAMGKSRRECISFLFSEWFPSVPRTGKPYYSSELRASIRSAYSGKYAGPSKEYVEGLTGIEFNIRIYKGRYKREKFHNKTENQQAIINYFRQHGGKIEMVQKELIEDICKTQISPLGKVFSSASIKRNLSKLKEEGTLNWESKGSGGNTKDKTTEFLLNDGIQTEQTIIEEDHNVYVLGKVINLN